MLFSRIFNENPFYLDLKKLIKLIYFIKIV